MLNDHSLLPNTPLADTHTQTQFANLPPQPIFCAAISPLTVFLGYKRFIKTSKRIECTISPAAWVWEDFNRNLELDFLCNLYSCVIFSHPIQSAEAACFLFSRHRGAEDERAEGGAREFGKISKCQLKPTINLTSSITCCLHYYTSS